MKNLLEVEGLTKKYREGEMENVVVNHIGLQVNEGEFVIIMGASGSGKTSLLHLLAGIDVFDQGRIRYIQPTSSKEVDFCHMKETAKAKFRRANIGIVFQQQCLLPDLTVYENIMLPVMLAGNRKKEVSIKETVLTLCKQFGLEGHVRKYPSQLSGGQQQRVAILRAVINKPPVLLCDEPTGSLNSAQSKLVMDLLNDLNGNGQTIILVTHDVKVAVRGKRILYIEDGHITGELKFEDTGSYKTGNRENELLHFLQQREW